MPTSRNVFSSILYLAVSVLVCGQAVLNAQKCPGTNEWPISTPDEYTFLGNANESIGCIWFEDNSTDRRPFINNSCIHDNRHIKVRWAASGDPSVGLIRFVHQMPESDLCLSAIEGKNTPGEPLTQMPCGNKNIDVRWRTWKLEKNNGYFAIRNQKNNLCVGYGPPDASGRRPVIQKDCAHDLNLWWSFCHTSPPPKEVQPPPPPPPTASSDRTTNPILEMCRYASTRR